MSRQIEVHVCAHFNAQRIPQLRTVLDAILEWRDCTVTVVVTSNSDAHEREAYWPEYQKRFEKAGHDLRLNTAADLANPFTLTWVHKRFLPAWLERTTSNDDLFIYIEDDIEITAANLEYFLETLKTTQKRSLIPGFLRFEKKDGRRRLVDIMQVEYWNLERNVVIDGKIFHACVNPYWAGFILNRELAREYAASRSYSFEDSVFVPWDIRERAAMGLTYERPDPRLRTRIVIPMIENAPDPDCFLWHCADNYTASNHPVVGSLWVEEGFQREGAAHFFLRKARSAVRKLAKLG